MTKKILFAIFIILSFNTFSQSKYSINFQVCPTVTFFKPFNANNSVFVYKQFGNEKNKIGICYSIELEKELGKNWSLSLGNSRLSYLVEYNSSEKLPTSYYNFEGSLRHTLSYITATLNRNLIKSNSDKLSLGLGAHIMNEKNQYFEIDASKRVYTFYEYSSTEAGMQIQLNYEKKIKENVNLGFNARLYYIISVDTIEDLVFGPYLKVNL